MTRLHTITRLTKEGNTFTATITLDPGHPVFAGHFPGQPVVPGVFLVEIISSVISQLTGEKMTVKEIANIKFLQMIDPVNHAVLLLDGSIVGEGINMIRVSGRIYTGDVEFAKFKGMLLESI
ncbi:MAG: hypothetical protein K0B08_07785 [Bacteroidales bacterium]|nr:hypothetical protein [Bacteroidales bacterium]